jgi:outer membrane protein assembly factor BamB
MAFDRLSGSLRWQQGVEYALPDPHHASNPHCAASPVTDGQRVVVSHGSAGVMAYDLSGALLWRTDLGKQSHDWGQGSSPVLHGETVIVYHGPGEFSALYGLDARTGKTKWTTPLKEAHPAERFDGFAGKNNGMIGTFCTPLVLSVGGRDEVILPVVNKLRSFSPEDGHEWWSADGMNPLVYGSATYGEGRLVAIGGFFGSTISIAPGGTGDRTAERKFYDRRAKRHSIGSPIIKDGYIYLAVTDGFAQCHELATGKQVWEERLPASGASGQIWSSMVLSGDKLYVVNQSGDTLILRASPRFEIIATNPLGELSNSTPAFSDGEIFLRTQAALYCIRETKTR